MPKSITYLESWETHEDGEYLCPHCNQKVYYGSPEQYCPMIHDYCGEIIDNSKDLVFKLGEVQK